MPRLFLVLPLMLCAALPAGADEFSDTLESALKAYKDGDVKTASDDLSYATKLLNTRKTEALARFLPAAPAGWTREDAAPDDGGIGMGMLGGGATVAATYTKGETSAELTLIADSPLVSSMGAMLKMAGLAGGKPFRVQRIEFAEIEGEVQGLVEDRVLIQISGDAPLEDKKALLEAMDLAGLGKS